MRFKSQIAQAYYLAGLVPAARIEMIAGTNVLVSGLLKAHSHAGAIVRLIAGGRIKVVYNARILFEYRGQTSR